MPGWPTMAEHLLAAEKAHLLATLRACQWNAAQAAQRIGMARSHVYRLMERHRVTPPSGKARNGNRGNGAWQELGA